MKKRISLILVLLIVFSVLLSTTVSAEKQPQSKNAPTLDDVFEIAPLEDNEAPRASDPDVPTVSDMFSTSPSDETMACSHKFKYTTYSTSQHKKTCTKCKAYFLENHDYNVYIENQGSHVKKCSKCPYSYTEQHKYYYKYANNSKHEKRCTECNYLASTSSCTKKYAQISDTKHKEYCKYCGHLFRELKHENDAFHCYNDFTHILICEKCGWTSKRISCKPYLIFVDSIHKKCKICGQRYIVRGNIIALE